MNLLRLDAEVIRDSILAASGQLDPTMGGPPRAAPLIVDGLQKLTDSQGKPLLLETQGNHRRSLYVLARRYYPLGFLETFDAPVIQTNCTRRVHSVSPLQSLALLNSDFVIDQAEHVAERALKLATTKAAVSPIDTAFLLTISRRPTPEETEVASEHLAAQQEGYRNSNISSEQARQQAFASLCHMLLASNEFLYVD
jgi:hypothetical protein